MRKRRAVPSADVTSKRDREQVRAIRTALGVVEGPDGKFLSQERSFDWGQLESNEQILWLASLTKRPIEGIIPWLTVPPQPSHEGWIVHFGEIFVDECPSCAEGIRCGRKYLPSSLLSLNFSV